jgi:hypothetical protein
VEQSISRTPTLSASPEKGELFHVEQFDNLPQSRFPLGFLPIIIASCCKIEVD